MLVAPATSSSASIHRGTTLTVVEHTPASARVKIEFPPHLYGPELLQGFAAGMRAAAIVAGGREVASGLDEPTATSAVYWFRWSV